MNELTFSKMDVIGTGFEEIKVCTSYIIDGEETKIFPLSLEEVERIKPVYKHLKAGIKGYTME